MNTAVLTALESLSMGQTPPDPAILKRLTVGSEYLLDFLIVEYLEDFIRRGGSKVKFLVGREGSGKTHLLRLLADAAAERDYLTALVDARDIRLNKFQTFYQSVLAGMDVTQLVRRYCAGLVGGLGYPPGEIPADMSFMNWVIARGQVPKLVRTELMKALEELYRNRRLNQYFALAFIYLCQDHLGLQALEPDQHAALVAWLQGNTLPNRAMHRMHIYSRIDKYNARHMLRSLVEVARLAGYAGLFVAVDNLEVVAARGPSGRPLYTRAARDEVYESLRQLIDDIDGLDGVFFVFALRNDLLVDQKAGIKTHEPLYLRLQNEVVGNRLNKFADLLDLDLAGKQFFGAEELAEVAKRINELRAAAGWPPVPLDGQKIHEYAHSSGAVAPIRRLVMAFAAPITAREGDEVGA